MSTRDDKDVRRGIGLHLRLVVVQEAQLHRFDAGRLGSFFTAATERQQHEPRFQLVLKAGQRFDQQIAPFDVIGQRERSETNHQLVRVDSQSFAASTLIDWFVHGRIDGV